MSFLRLSLFPLSVGSILVVAGAMAWPSLRPAPAAAVAPPPTTADPVAERLLDQALARLDPRRLAWTETGVWQRVEAQGLTYQAEGRYLAGPGGRFRLDLTTHVGGTEGGLLLVSDGIAVWQATRVNSPDWTSVQRTRVGEPVAHAGPVPPVSAPSTPLAGGLYPLLQGLRQRLQWTRAETVRRGGRELVRLTAGWSAEVAATLVATGSGWPAGLPRQCRLYLDPRTLWPHRLEWWGPDPPREGDVVLAQMELREPVLNRALPAERCASEFSFQK